MTIHPGLHLSCGPSIVINRVPFCPASILAYTINQMITPAISVHAYGSNQLYSSASLRQDELLLFHLCLSFFLVPHKETGKQVISLSTQIIGEKPQTVSGPLWVTIHSPVVLTLLMVALDVRNSDLCSWALPYGITALVGRVWWGGFWGIITSFLLSSLPSTSGTSLSERLQFLLHLNPKAGWGWGGWREREAGRETDSFIYLFSSSIDV